MNQCYFSSRGSAVDAFRSIIKRMREKEKIFFEEVSCDDFSISQALYIISYHNILYNYTVYQLR